MNYVDSTGNRGYILGVTKPPVSEKRIANVAVKLYPSLKEELERIAGHEVRTLSQVTLFLIERGLAAYKRDGVLREPGGIALAMIRDKDNRSFVNEPAAEYGEKARKRKGR